jgi:hypothetical protein
MYQSPGVASYEPTRLRTIRMRIIPDLTSVFFEQPERLLYYRHYLI